MVAGGISRAKTAWREAALPFVRFRFHAPRYQAITELAEGGATDATRMAVAGHLTREMPEHYSHARTAATRAAVSKLESGVIAPVSSEPEPFTRRGLCRKPCHKIRFRI